jgi:hypothetical protein
MIPWSMKNLNKNRNRKWVLVWRSRNLKRNNQLWKRVLVQWLELRHNTTKTWLHRYDHRSPTKPKMYDITSIVTVQSQNRINCEGCVCSDQRTWWAVIHAEHVKLGGVGTTVVARVATLLVSQRHIDIVGELFWEHWFGVIFYSAIS